jgi:TonB family protein
MIYKSFSVCIFALLLAAVAGAANKQDEGRQLIARAIELSDIRAEGSPAFRMRASFQVLSTVSTNRGNYSELWASGGQWRREIETTDFHRIEVVQGKRWLFDSNATIPFGSGVVANALSQRIVTDQLKIKEITDKELGGRQVRCVKSETEFIIQMYCVNPTDNTLVSDESLSRTSGGHTNYLYKDYESFGNKIFPRTIEYKSEGEPGVEIRVVELSAEVSPGASQFEPPPGAFELANCLPSEMTPPTVKSSPDPDFPGGTKASSALVVLSMIVASDGALHNVQVVKSGGMPFDKEAVRAVQRWRFRAPTCLGEPVATQINVEVQFRR